MVIIITIITTAITPSIIIIITTGTIGTSALIRAVVWGPAPDTISHSAPMYLQGPFSFAQNLRQLGDVRRNVHGHHNTLLGLIQVKANAPWQLKMARSLKTETGEIP